MGHARAHAAQAGAVARDAGVRGVAQAHGHHHAGAGLQGLRGRGHHHRLAGRRHLDEPQGALAHHRVVIGHGHGYHQRLARRGALAILVEGGGDPRLGHFQGLVGRQEQVFLGDAAGEGSREVHARLRGETEVRGQRVAPHEGGAGIDLADEAGAADLGLDQRADRVAVAQSAGGAHLEPVAVRVVVAIQRDQAVLVAEQQVHVAVIVDVAGVGAAVVGVRGRAERCMLFHETTD